MTPSAIQAGYRTIAKCDALRASCPVQQDRKTVWGLWVAAAVVAVPAILTFNHRMATVEANQSHMKTSLENIETILDDKHPRGGG